MGEYFNLCVQKDLKKRQKVKSGRVGTRAHAEVKLTISRRITSKAVQHIGMDRSDGSKKDWITIDA
jgi:hypothetical protein